MHAETRRWLYTQWYWRYKVGGRKRATANETMRKFQTANRKFNFTHFTHRGRWTKEGEKTTIVWPSFLQSQAKLHTAHIQETILTLELRCWWSRTCCDHLTFISFSSMLPSINTYRDNNVVDEDLLATIYTILVGHYYVQYLCWRYNILFNKAKNGQSVEAASIDADYSWRVSRSQTSSSEYELVAFRS